MIKMTVKNLPTTFPVTFTLTIWLLIREFKIDGICLGVIITVLAIYWVAIIIAFILQIFRGKTFEVMEDGTIKVNKII